MPYRHHGLNAGSVRGRRRRVLSAPMLALMAVLVVAAAIVILRPKETMALAIEVDVAHDYYERGTLFVDVRTADEWAQGHIPRSILIPLDELPDRLEEMPRDADIIVVCRSGARSKEGVGILRQAGFDRATCMNGGIQAWTEAGYPLER
jgi:rhodanese-related sulfurtransferase